MSNINDPGYAKQQLAEAILAGERALSILGDAQKALGSAEGWGLFDLLGGGFISTMVKRSKMKDAKRDIEEANRALRAFQRELRDVSLRFDHELDDSGLLSFADYFFDDFLSDFLVQRRINDAQKRLGDTQREISSIVDALKKKLASL